MDPILAAIFGAANDPGTWGPMLDALGPQFGPEAMIPQLQKVAMGGNPGMFSGMAPQQPGMPPVAAPQAAPQPAPAAPVAPPGTAPALQADASQPYTGVSAASMRSPQVQPQVKAPEQPKPVFQAGVAGAQKAPDFGTKGGNTTQQMILQALLGGGAGAGGPAIPSIGALLGGGRY